MFRFVEFAGPQGVLRGSLQLPDHVSRPNAGVVMCHGCTGERMESSFLFVGLSRHLAAAGIASLRFDFFGSGESDGEFEQMTVSGERADAMTAIDFFKALPEIDAARIGLLGMSLGGYVSACVLGARSDIRAAALWSAAGETLSRWFARLTPAQRERLQQEGWVDRSGLRMSGRFFEDLSQNKPYELIAGYRGPVLVVHAANDETVPPAEGQRYAEVLEKRPQSRTERLFVAGGGHVFSKWEPRQEVYRGTVDWFKKQL